MVKDETKKFKRDSQPLCRRCSHPRSFHGSGKCKAMGCVNCDAYIAPDEASTSAA